MKHELMPVPISLANTDGTLRTGDKSLLVDMLTEGVDCPNSIHLDGSSCLIIDGQALVRAIGKPKDACTFGELADEYVKHVLEMGNKFERIDVLFDCYDGISVKGEKKKKRGKGKKIHQEVCC